MLLNKSLDEQQIKSAHIDEMGNSMAALSEQVTSQEA
jgi:hypothetical protein